MRAGYFLSGGPLTPFPGPPFFKMAAESNFPPWDVQDVKFPPPPQSWGKPLIGAYVFPYGGLISFINSFVVIQLTIGLIDFSILNSLIITRGLQ